MVKELGQGVSSGFFYAKRSEHRRRERENDFKALEC